MLRSVRAAGGHQRPHLPGRYVNRLFDGIIMNRLFGDSSGWQAPQRPHLPGRVREKKGVASYAVLCAVLCCVVAVLCCAVLCCAV